MISTNILTPTQHQQLQIDSELVASYETESQAKLQELSQTSQEIDRLTSLRNRWLEAISAMSTREVELFARRLQILRVRTELASAELMSDISLLEGKYESQTLSYLIEATKPIYSNEIQDFNTSLNALTRQNLERIKECTRESLKKRSQIVSQLLNYESQLEKIKIEYKSSYEAAVNRVKARLEDFITSTESRQTTCKANHKTITGEYLVLRHNSKIAQERLTRSKNQVSKERQELHDNFQNFVQSLKGEREQVEAAAREELKIVIDEMRKQLLQHENAVDEKEQQVRNKELCAKREIQRLRNEYRIYEGKYEDLQKKRALELNGMGNDVKILREMIKKSEMHLIFNPVI